MNIIPRDLTKYHLTKFRVGQRVILNYSNSEWTGRVGTIMAVPDEHGYATHASYSSTSLPPSSKAAWGDAYIIAVDHPPNGRRKIIGWYEGLIEAYHGDT